jgi:hypothetical protein
MNPTESILAFTGLIELFLVLVLLWRDANRPAQRKHFVARVSKFPRSYRDSQGTWVID